MYYSMLFSLPIVKKAIIVDHLFWFPLDPHLLAFPKHLQYHGCSPPVILDNLFGSHLIHTDENTVECENSARGKDHYNPGRV